MTVLKTCVSLAASLITGTPLDVSRAAAVDSGQKALLVDNNNSPVLRPPSLSSLHDHKANAKFRCYAGSGNQTIPNGTSPCTTLKSDQSNGFVNGHTKVFANGYANGCANGHANGFANGHANGYANGYATGLNGHVPSTLTQSSHTKSHQPHERWVRPLGYAERCMSKAHDYGCMTTVYALWLSSKAPLDFELIQHAAEIMYRKMPNLRMKLSHRDGELWWKESPRATLDVEELVTDNIEASVESLLHRRYNLEEGPLWFARFVTLPKSENEDCEDVEVEHKYVCIFGFHHNASDGTSNMKFCNVFLKVLNDLSMGKEVDMKEEGTFAMPLQDALGDQIHTLWFFLCVFFKRLYTAILTFGVSVRNFTSRYKMPASNAAATHILQHELDEVTTKKLISRCKMEGVTLNSAFTAAANLSMYEMMISRDEELDETYLWSQQAINMRRYWPQELQPNTLGCHISLLDISFPTKRRDLHSFWEYARDVNRRLQHMLVEEKRPLKLQPMSQRLIILIRHNSWLAWLGLPSANDNHYTVTNMGNLHTAFPGVGEVVEATKVLRSVSCHFMPTLCQHTLQTFRGRFCYSLDYYTQKLSKETATTYAQGIMNLLRKSIHSPN
ncbi:uncharacterized protein LOC135212586 [Macrobrachium nipponense]|uniref:uncharacterized protein LOC135212586 n=1 Tax=Macrobrachium nipponense TaxID=159736 RepID=UPI0030C89DD6